MSHPVHYLIHGLLALLYLGAWFLPVSLQNISFLKSVRFSLCLLALLAMAYSFGLAQALPWSFAVGLVLYYIVASVSLGYFWRIIKEIILKENGKLRIVPYAMAVKPKTEWFFYEDPSFAVVLNEGSDFLSDSKRAVYIRIRFTPRGIAQAYEASGKVSYDVPAGSLVSLEKFFAKELHAQATDILKQSEYAEGFAQSRPESIHAANVALTKAFQELFGFQIDFRLDDTYEPKYSPEEEPEPDDILYNAPEMRRLNVLD